MCLWIYVDVYHKNLQKSLSVYLDGKKGSMIETGL